MLLYKKHSITKNMNMQECASDHKLDILFIYKINSCLTVFCKGVKHFEQMSKMGHN